MQLFIIIYFCCKQLYQSLNSYELLMYLNLPLFEKGELKVN